MNKKEWITVKKRYPKGLVNKFFLDYHKFWGVLMFSQIKVQHLSLARNFPAIPAINKYLPQKLAIFKPQE
jgi:hypothetical protein